MIPLYCAGFLSVILLALLLCGCVGQGGDANNQRSINVCIAKGGVPAFTWNGYIKDCKK